MRGRKPTPTAVRALQGNPGKRRLNDAEPQPPPLAGRVEAASADPDAPPGDVLRSPLAVAEWRRLVPMLRQCRQITEADRAALIALCLEYARYLDATAKVDQAGMVVKSPSGYPMQNPYLSIARGALIACTKLWVELGLTPSSRSRVTTVGVTGVGPITDDFSEFDEAPQPFAH